MTHTAPPPADPAPPRRRRWLGLALGLVAVAVLLAWALPWGLSALLQQQLPARLGERLGRPVQLARAEVALLPPRVVLEGLRIGPAAQRPDDPPLLALRRLEATLATGASLRHAAVVVQSLALDGLQLALARTAPGQTSIDDVLARLRPAEPPPPDDGSPPAWALYNLQLRDGQVLLDDRPAGRQHRLTQWSLALPFLSALPADVTVQVTPQLALQYNGQPLQADGRLLPFADDHASELALHLPELDLAPLAVYLPAAVPVRLAQGHLSSRLQLQFRQPKGAAAALQVSGEVGLRAVALTDRSDRPVLAWRQLDLPLVDVQPMARRLVLGTVKLQGPTVPMWRLANGQLHPLQALAGSTTAAPPTATPPHAASRATGGTTAPMPAASAASAAAAPVPAADGDGWVLQWAGLDLADGALDLQDQVVQPRLALRLADLALQVGAGRWPQPTAAMPVALAGALHPGGPTATSAAPAATAASTASAASPASAPSSRPARPTPPTGGRPKAGPSSPREGLADASPATSLGRFTVQGELAPAATGTGTNTNTALPELRLQFAVDALALATAQPYLNAWLAPRLDGQLTARGRLDWSAQRPAPGLRAQVDLLQLDRLRLAGPGLPSASLAALRLQGVQVDTATRRVQAERLALDRPQLQAGRRADGQLDLQAWLRTTAPITPPATPPAEPTVSAAAKRTATTAKAKATVNPGTAAATSARAEGPAAKPTPVAHAGSAATAPAADWQLALNQLTVHDGQLQFTDAAVAGGDTAPVQLGLRGLRLQASGLRWPLAERLPQGPRLSLDTRLDAGPGSPVGRLRWDGQFAGPPWQLRGQVQAERLPLHLADRYAAPALGQIALAEAEGSLNTRLALQQRADGWQVEVEGDVQLADWLLNLRQVATDAGPRTGSPAQAARPTQPVRAAQTAQTALADSRPGSADGSGRELLSWQSLQLQGLKFQQTPGSPPRLAVQAVAAHDLYSRLVITEQGQLNLNDVRPAAAGQAAGAASAPGSVAVAAPPAAAAAATMPPASSPAAPSPATAAARADAGWPIEVDIGGIRLHNGRVDFTDRFIRPNYSARLSALEGTLGRFQSGSREMATLQVTGRAADTALLDIRGQINPSVQPLALDIRARATDLELAPLSAYSGKYAGYAIERGKLSMDVQYKISPDGRLEAQNQVILNQLTFGDKVDSPDATKLPVLLAVALLKDRHGVIDINLPVSGSLDDPQFSVGGLVLKVIVNLLTKALTAPFALLAGAGSGPDLSQVTFVPGTARIGTDGQQVLDKVAKALLDRPSLHLTVAGTADAQQEREAYRADQLEARLQAEHRRQLARAAPATGLAGAAPNPGAASPASAPAAAASAAATGAPPPAIIGLDRRQQLLRELYRQAPLPDKPRNALGLLRELPLGEMEAKLKAAIALDDEAARALALQRGLAVRDALVARGLPAQRLFLAAPRLHAADAPAAAMGPATAPAASAASGAAAGWQPSAALTLATP